MAALVGLTVMWTLLGISIAAFGVIRLTTIQRTVSVRRPATPDPVSCSPGSSAISVICSWGSVDLIERPRD